MKTKNKIAIFFQRLGDSTIGNWLAEKTRSIFELCINNAYRLFFIFLILGLTVQPVLFGAKFFLYETSILFVMIVILITMLFTVTDSEKAGKIRRITFFITGFLYAILMTNIYSYSTNHNVDYVFNKGKLIEDIIFWNPLFKSKYPNFQSRPKTVSFEVVTKQGDFEIKHSCTAYIDANTWILFALDEQKLTSFLRNDAKERLIASLNECRLDQVSNMSKTLYYSNSKFVRAKIE